MSLEQSIQNLADANLKLAAAVETFVRSAIAGGAPLPVDLTQSGKLTSQQEEAERYEAEQPKRGRGRPRKVEPTASSDEFPAEVDAPVVPPKAPAPAPKATSVDAPLLRSTLIEVVQKHGRDKCGELCRKHGGANLSALDPSVYPAIYADALALLEQDPE